MAQELDWRGPSLKFSREWVLLIKGAQKAPSLSLALLTSGGLPFPTVQTLSHVSGRLQSSEPRASLNKGGHSCLLVLCDSEEECLQVPHCSTASTSWASGMNKWVAHLRLPLANTQEGQGSPLWVRGKGGKGREKDASPLSTPALAKGLHSLASPHSGERDLFCFVFLMCLRAVIEPLCVRAGIWTEVCLRPDFLFTEDGTDRYVV